MEPLYLPTICPLARAANYPMASHQWLRQSVAFGSPQVEALLLSLFRDT